MKPTRMKPIGMKLIGMKPIGMKIIELMGQETIIIETRITEMKTTETMVTADPITETIITTDLISQETRTKILHGNTKIPDLTARPNVQKVNLSCEHRCSETCQNPLKCLIREIKLVRKPVKTTTVSADPGLTAKTADVMIVL
jgi:hypothetical protein